MPLPDGDLGYIILPYACFGIIIRRGIVVDATPIGKWMIGKPWGVVDEWVKSKGGSFIYKRGRV